MKLWVDAMMCTCDVYVRSWDKGVRACMRVRVCGVCVCVYECVHITVIICVYVHVHAFHFRTEEDQST